MLSLYVSLFMRKRRYTQPHTCRQTLKTIIGIPYSFSCFICWLFLLSLLNRLLHIRFRVRFFSCYWHSILFLSFALCVCMRPRALDGLKRLLFVQLDAVVAVAIPFCAHAHVRSPTFLFPFCILVDFELKFASQKVSV